MGWSMLMPFKYILLHTIIVSFLNSRAWHSNRVQIIKWIKLKLPPRLHPQIHFVWNLLRNFLSGLLLLLHVQLFHIMLKLLMVSFLFSIAFGNIFFLKFWLVVHPTEIVVVNESHVVIFWFTQTRNLKAISFLTGTCIPIPSSISRPDAITLQEASATASP